MRHHATPSRRPTRSRALLVSSALAVALVGCGNQAATDAGTGTSSGATATAATSTSTATSTTAVAPPATTVGSSVAPTTVAPAAAPRSVVTTTTAKPGPSAADVAELERALDDIDKTLTDIQTEMNDN